MSHQRFAIIDPSNIIVGIIYYNKGETPTANNTIFPNCCFVACDDNVGRQADGWTYVNGEFIPPNPSVTPAPILPSTPVATISDLQAQLLAIQAQLNALLSSAIPNPVLIPVVEPAVVEPAVVEPAAVEPVVEPAVTPQ